MINKTLTVMVARAQDRRNLISPIFVSTLCVYVHEEGSPLTGVPPLHVCALFWAYPPAWHLLSC